MYEEMIAAENEMFINEFKSRVLENAKKAKEAWDRGENLFILRTADLINAERYTFYGANLEELNSFIEEAYNF